jgi:hypothetical protein
MEFEDFAFEHVFDEMRYEIDEYNKSKTDEKWAKLLSCWRHRYESFVYDVLKQRYGTILDTFWKSYEPPLNSDRAFVLVERRCHPNLWFILRNIAYFGKGWSIYLFCSKQNYAYCAAILGKNLKNVHLKIIYDVLAEPKDAIEDYNNTMKSASFWEQIGAETLCVFQMDCYLRKPIPDEILEYDYVSSPWIWNTKSPGGGGLSIRKRSVMIDICSRKEPALIPEDGFIAQGLCELGYNFLHSSESKKYFMESYLSEDPVGIHQWWTFYCNIIYDSKDSKDTLRTLLTLNI